MRKAQLPDHEKQICGRLKRLRELLGLSERAIASKVGITQGKWHNYEMFRSPLRCDVALHICRQLIVSEEWLATGSFRLTEDAARTHGVMPSASLHDFYIRNLVDLRSDPKYLEIAPGELFSVAFGSILAPRYRALVENFFYVPRLVFRDSDSDELMASYVTVLNERWLKLLRNESRRLSRGEGLAGRQFLRCQVDFGSILFRRFMGVPTPEIKDESHNFLRAIANDPRYPLGPLQDKNPSESLEGLLPLLRESKFRFSQRLEVFK